MLKSKKSNSNSNSNSWTSSTVGSSGKTSTSGSSKAKKKKIFVMRCIFFLVLFVCGILAFFSAAPWEAAGTTISNAVLGLGFWTNLEKIFLVGILFTLIRWVVLTFMPLLLWGLINLIEVTPILIMDVDIQASILEAAKEWNMKTTDRDDVIGKIQNKLANFIPDLLNQIGWFAAAAYLAELVVNVWHYMPYGKGWQDFVSDAGAWDPELFNWTAIFQMIGSMGIVEGLAVFILLVYRIYKFMLPRTRKA